MISYNSSRTPEVIVVANKSDKPYNHETYEICVEKYRKRGITCFKTSAESGENVKEAFDKLVSLMVETRQLKDRVLENTMSVGVDLVADYPTEKSTRSCC